MEEKVSSEFSVEAIRIFKALSDPTRYQMVRMLLNCNELGCVEFEKAFELSKPAMSHHYRVLENAGLLSSRKEGVYVYFSLDKEWLERFLPGFDQAHQ
jgi:DNA-binding transcriptional ArsR family regulator